MNRKQKKNKRLNARAHTKMFKNSGYVPKKESQVIALQDHADYWCEYDKFEKESLEELVNDWRYKPSKNTMICLVIIVLCMLLTWWMFKVNL